MYKYCVYNTVTDASQPETPKYTSQSVKKSSLAIHTPVKYKGKARVNEE